MLSSRRHIKYIECLVEEIMSVTEETLQASASSLLLIDDEEQEMSFRFVHGPAEGILTEATLGTETGIAGWVARHREPVIVNDVSADQRFCGDLDEITGFRTRSVICAPLEAHGKLVGVISRRDILRALEALERQVSHPRQDTTYEAIEKRHRELD